MVQYLDNAEAGGADVGEMLDAIREAKRPMALTGAGISAPSGVPTFDMRWKGRPVRDFLGRKFFQRAPVRFFELYCALEQWADATPNAAHRALAAHGVRIVTQNVEGLHQKAGSGEVLEIHGNLRNILCPVHGVVATAHDLCAALRPLYADKDYSAVQSKLYCECGKPLDVDVVLYGDPVRDFEKAVDWLMESDLLLVIGTSLQMYPAASLPEMARERGVKVLIEDADCIAALSEEQVGASE